MAKPKKRWFQFSLGSLLLVMTVFGVWLGLRMDRARRQERAVAALRERGDVSYESRFLAPSLNSRFAKKVFYGPKFLHALMGNDFFGRVRAVHLDKSPTDNDLRCLEDLPDIESLVIDGPEISDAGLQHLQHLHALKELVLKSPRISDAGLVHLQSLQELRVLFVLCPVTDKGILALAPLKRLERLDVTAFGSNPTCTKAAFMLFSQTQLDCSELPVAFVVEELSELHGTKISLDNEALQAAKIRTDFPLSVAVSGQRLDAAFDTIFSDTGLDWILTPNGIVVTTKEKAAAKVAGVRELKKRLPNLKHVVYVVAP